MKNDQHNQRTLFETERPETRDSGPVTCLGLTFPNDEERRKHFLGLLRAAFSTRDLLGLYKDEVGFPIGSDEDILALSDPPYYTACPNPFIRDFIVHWSNEQRGLRTEQETNDTQSSALSTQSYHREPFAADVSEGKNDPIYNAHCYHTKVQHKAIMRHILHYTEPGDILFDGFCGTGMTGMAAQLTDCPHQGRRGGQSQTCAGLC